MSFAAGPTGLPPGALRGTAPGEVLVHADQAIFTSVRSPTSEGYRIVAANLGVRAEERREITRRSPSHSGLCSNRTDAVGLCAYPLSTGRYCVAYSQYAGVEHTARGGQRIYTHVVVLDRSGYRRFLCDPVRVHAALAETIGDAPIKKLPSSLGSVSLKAPAVSGGKSAMPLSACMRSCDADRLAYVVSLVLCGQPLIVADALTPFSFLECMLMALPLSAREALSVSVGLKFAPSRQIQLTFIERDLCETQRTIKGHGIKWVDANAVPPREASPFFGWLDLIRRWWHEGRFADLSRLTGELDVDLDPSVLERIAAVCDDLDRVNDGDRAGLERLRHKYAAHKAANKAEAKLVQQLLAALENRAST